MITILGPTASGKTSVAVHLAAEIGGEIISADSRQVYRRMDIGTGKDLSDYTITNNHEPITIPYTTIVKGDGKYLAIAAASILAKTYRDDYMNELAKEYPQYDWLSNKGYPTKKHRDAIRQYGITPYHRKSYNLLGTEELSLDFGEF